MVSFWVGKAHDVATVTFPIHLPTYFLAKFGEVASVVPFVPAFRFLCGFVCFLGLLLNLWASGCAFRFLSGVYGILGASDSARVAFVRSVFFLPASNGIRRRNWSSPSQHGRGGRAAACILIS